MADQCLQHLLQEHRAAEKVLARLDALRSEFAAIAAEAGRMIECSSALCAGKSSPELNRKFLRAGRGFGQLLRDHIYKEDRVLFPMVARYLPAEKDSELLAAMSRCCPPDHCAGG